MRRLLVALALLSGCAGVVFAGETTRADGAPREASGAVRMTSGTPVAVSRLADGDAALREARIRVDRNVGDDTALAYLADTLRELAVRAPSRADALGEIGESLSIREGLMDREAQHPSWIWTLADDYGLYGSRLAAAGEHATAIGAYSRRLAILASLRDVSATGAPSAGELAREHMALAEAARKMDEPVLAAREDGLALSAFREQLREDYLSADPAARPAGVVGRISAVHEAVAGILTRAGNAEAAVAEHFFGIAAVSGSPAMRETAAQLVCGHYRAIEAIYAGTGEAAKAAAARTLAGGVCLRQ